MTAHILTRREEADYAESYPGERPEYEDHLECPVGCSGWQECREDKHAVPGYEGVNDGPYDSEEDAPWFDEEEFEFHGVLHTWNGYVYEWTIPYEGCVVAGNDWSDPYNIPEREGRWLVDDDWDDTTVTLSGICELEDGVARGTLIRPMPKNGSSTWGGRFIASYLQSQEVPAQYATAFGAEFWLEGRETAATLSAPSVLLASQKGVPAEYAHLADTYASLFVYGEQRAETVILLFEANVSADYIRLGMAHRIEPSALIKASRERIPAEFLSAVRGE